MTIISQVGSITHNNISKPALKNIAKVTLPALSSLGVLAGSSLGGSEFPVGNPPALGASVTDPISDQLAYTGDMALDCASEIGHAALEGVSELTDGLSDLVGKALNMLS